MGLVGFGIFFLFLGMLLFFDNGLLAMGNVGGVFVSIKHRFGKKSKRVVLPKRLWPYDGVRTDVNYPDQIFFVAGLALIIGLRSTFAFFFQRHKVKVCFYIRYSFFTSCIGEVNVDAGDVRSRAHSITGCLDLIKSSPYHGFRGRDAFSAALSSSSWGGPSLAWCSRCLAPFTFLGEFGAELN